MTLRCRLYCLFVAGLALLVEAAVALDDSAPLFQRIDAAVSGVDEVVVVGATVVEVVVVGGVVVVVVVEVVEVVEVVVVDVVDVVLVDVVLVDVLDVVVVDVEVVVVVPSSNQPKTSTLSRWKRACQSS